MQAPISRHSPSRAYAHAYLEFLRQARVQGPAVPRETDIDDINDQSFRESGAEMTHGFATVEKPLESVKAVERTISDISAANLRRRSLNLNFWCRARAI
jgi:hypothetical protein